MLLLIPDRKILETILDFGEPLLSLLDDTAPIDLQRNALKIVITVWNAHVMAMPLWGHPEHLHQVTDLLRGSDAAPEMIALIVVLANRRKVWFKDDPRAVGKWTIKPGAEGYRFRCDARLPHAVMAQAREPHADAES